MRVRVLGGVRLVGPSGDASPGGDHARRLLAALVIARGQTVPARALVRVVWGDDADDSGPNLRMAISRLRTRLQEVGLGPSSISAGAGGYRFTTPLGAVDAEIFVAGVEDARRVAGVAPDQAIGMFREALALWWGDAFAPYGSEPWALTAASRLTDLRLGAEEELADLELDAGRAATIIDRLLEASEAHPYREHRWVQLAIALVRLDRQTDALRSLARGRRLLLEQLGLQPGSELSRVEQAVLAQDPSLRSSGRRDHGVGPTLVGRQRELSDVPRLLRLNRVVTVVGLGGVGKSALARAVAMVGASAGQATVVLLDAIADPTEVRLAFCSAVGVLDTEHPDDLPVVLGLRLRESTLLVLDGAENAVGQIAELVDRLVLSVPGLRVLITSRVPVGVTGEVTYTLEPLAVGSPASPGPAMHLFLERAGAPWRLDDDARLTLVARVCERVGGLPLAVELAAGNADLVDIAGLETLDAASVAALEAVVEWSVDAVPDESRALLASAALLPAGLSMSAAAALARTTESGARRILAPLTHTRLVGAVGVDALGVRYRSLEPVRQIALRLLGPDVTSASHQVVDYLCGAGAAVGAPYGSPHLDALPGVEAEFANARHWLGQTLGAERGLDLAVSLTRAWAESGRGAEGLSWLQRHLAATPPPDALLRARAAVAEVSLQGLFGPRRAHEESLVEAACIAEVCEDWALWLVATAYLAMIHGERGDVNQAYALLWGGQAHERLAAVGDDWFAAQRARLIAVGPAAVGRYVDARDALDGVAERFSACGDTASDVETRHLRAFLARTAGDIGGAEADLLIARDVAGSGAVARTRALIEAELAVLAHHRSDPDALAMLFGAVDDLEQSGDTETASMYRRELATWRLQAGDVDGGIEDLVAILPILLRVDPRAAGLALVEVVGARGHRAPQVTAELADTARALLHETPGPELPVDLRRRAAEVLGEPDTWGAAVPTMLAPDEIYASAASLRSVE